MLKRIFISIFLIILAFRCTSNRTTCSDSQIKDFPSYKEVSKMLLSLVHEYKGREPDFPQNLPEFEPFKTIFENPCIYKKCLLEAIKDPNQNRLYKYFALHCLFRLCIEDYVEVIATVFNEYKKGILDDGFLELSIHQNLISIEVYRNYNHKKLKKILTKIKIYKEKIGKNTNHIDKVISGKQWKEQVYFYYDTGHDKLPWHCK